MWIPQIAVHIWISFVISHTSEKKLRKKTKIKNTSTAVLLPRLQSAYGWNPSTETALCTTFIGQRWRMTTKGRLLSSSVTVKRFHAKNCEIFPSPPELLAWWSPRGICLGSRRPRGSLSGSASPRPHAVLPRSGIWYTFFMKLLCSVFHW